MNTQEQVAYINTQALCARIEMEGMLAENQHRMNCGNSIAYGDEAFNKIATKYGIHHNQVLELFHGD